MPHPIEAAASKFVFSNHGSGTQSAHTGSGSQNNNSADGAQYNANAIYIIEKYHAAASSGDPPSDIEELRLKERRVCLQSLSFLNIDARRQDIASAHPTTCDWFFQTSEFQQWHNRTDFTTHNGVLWVKGNPGTGKSTLMKHTLEHCRRVLKHHTIAAYFFNARGDAFEKTPLGMLRSLVFQLVNKEPSAYDRFVLIFRKKYEMHQGGWGWRESELREFLLSEIQQYLLKPLILLIDALDECSKPHVRDIVEFLEELSVKASSAKTTLNICLSSRHYPHISMKRYQELVVEKMEEHNDDITTYVCDKLTKQDKEIERDLLAKASGVFMWVVLVVTMLNTAYDEGKIEAMQQKLREVPDDLDKLFGTLLGQDNSDKRETILMLQWVLFARRLLKPEELYYAMLAGTDADNLGTWDPSKITRDDIRRRITNSSRGLIEVRKGNAETVQFIHESVNDFLLRNQRLQRLDAALASNPVGASHDCLKACCMSYITMDALPLPRDRAQAKSFRSTHPFLEYASTYVFDHVEAAEAGHIGQVEFLRCLREEDSVFQRVRLFHNSFEQNPGSRCVGGVDLLYMTAVHGYGSLVKSLLGDGADIDAQGGLYGMALQAAAGEGNKEIVAMLLDKGADVNAPGGPYGTALQAAAGEGNEEIVAVLLDKGADVNAQGGLYGTAIQAAAGKGNKEIMMILLDKGADINTQGGLFSTTLQAAAGKGNEEIVAILLDKGADVNAQGGPFGTALQVAADQGNKEIVAILLDKGADVNAQGGLFGTALQVAAGRGNKEIVAMLLDKGADVNAQGGLYGTALQAATYKENEEIVAMLLDKGADVNAQGGPHGTALQAAAGEGNKEMIVAMLLDKGADVNAQGGLSGTALQVAAGEGNKEIVAMLLDKGADVNAQGGLSGTALQVAAGRGNKEIVAMLLDKGADVNAQVGLFSTALQVATGQGNKEIVAMLLDKGADVNAQGGLFGTALQVAAGRGNKEIVAMLLDKGADVNAQGGLYGTALQAAIFEKNEEIMAVLLEKGADITALGGSVLQVATFQGREETVASLFDKTASGTTLQAAVILIIMLLFLWFNW
ncbi:ankyrin repeat-containing domain protein [Lasiosphaeria hispida]|uniref:protein S-acyltransferase n=1 Tax=Lasiosphaeria hispida TaxID=260671 RepID=A0AAJ0HC10_9PEZI|nr:ankyrin repeat-containing domain protein [Lasiosphaeria hispida]